MGNPSTGIWQGIEFRTEQRSVEATSGPTLRIGPIRENPDDPDSESAEWLRFDCFNLDPHWHIDPTGRDELHPLAEIGDPISETFEILALDLPQLLAQAGADSDIVKAISALDQQNDRKRFLHEAELSMRHRSINFDDIDIRALENRRSAKWRFHPRDVLPAWVAEMDYPIATPIQDELRRLTENSDAGYPMSDADTGLPEAFRERMNERFGWNPDPARVELLSEVVQGMYIALEAFTEKGDGAIVQTPIYPPFLGVVAETGRRLVENPMIQGDNRLEFDLDRLATVIDADTRILLLCNPHNPSGRVIERSELTELARLVLKHDLLVVSDEIHADLLYDGRQHIPFASLGEEIAKRTVTLTSASKAFNIPGLRCAIAHFGTEDLQKRFNLLHPQHIRGGIGLFGIYASIAAWRWGQPWLDEVVTYLQGNRDFALQALQERIPEIEFMSPESTYLAWLDCEKLEIEGSPAAHFLRHGKVALSGGRRFGAAWENHVRLNFATSRPILTELIDRMAKGLGR
ncbi:MAG: PatB family C-S lyase [Myxococcales bacterium]|nr:putative C-S lyase [Myxococcales bacterium]HIK84729.1 putative C-S lyase [Myxococcales bacterium]